MAPNRWRRLAAPLLAAVLLLELAGCGGRRAGAGQGGGRWKATPVLYPNAHYESVGPEVIEADISSCMYRAESTVGNASTGGTVAKNTGGGAALGAVLGAVSGAIFGRPGAGAAAGAATGAISGAARGTAESRNNDPVFERFVERCLADEGYDVIGWK